MTQLIDWHNDDGVNIDMISNAARNQFYDAALSEAKGQHCVDIGFGTGLLTLLALKHGALSVTAYESDPERFRFGQRMIQHLGIGHCVTLHNQTYCADPKDSRLIFHEVLGNNLWDESAWSFVAHMRCIIPAVYHSEVWIAPIDPAQLAVLKDQRWAQHQQLRFATWYNNIRDPSWPDCASPDQFDQLPQHIQVECAECFGWDADRSMLQYKFDPGVAIDSKYQQLIETAVNAADHATQVGAISSIAWQQDARSVYHQLLAKAVCAHEWTLDAANQTFAVRGLHSSQTRAWPHNEIDIVLDPVHYQHQQVAVLTRHAIEHQGQRLYLSDSCWAPPAQGAAIFDHVAGTVGLRQNLNTGQIRYFEFPHSPK